MLFNSFQFALFFAAVLIAFRSLPPRARNPLLLGASLLFYTLWIPAYLVLLLTDIGVNYALLLAMARTRHPRLFLALSSIFTLSLLAFYKYAAFLVETAIPILPQGVEAPAVPEIFLPLGISFYSFQILALAIDRYRNPGQSIPSLGRYALFISFFPQLIAGPILRGSELLPQLERGAKPTPERTRRGLWLLASGLFKKVVFADFLLSPFVEEVFSVPGTGSTPIHLVAIYSFAFQIYFDFSGYTDMARGLACLLGFEIPKNFMEPYLSRNPAEFWRRWHITLSQWLRDYLYVPLGGNRRGPSRVYVNLAFTMVLGGLWHGAAWNFVIWGAFHGAFLVIHRRFGRDRRRIDGPLSLRDAPRIFLLFHGVCLLWIFFRAPTAADAFAFIGGILTGGELGAWPVLQTGVVALCFALHVLERGARLRAARIRSVLARSWWGAAAEGAALGAIVGLAVAVAGTGGEFIYFQF